jgi:hypothetical protein
MKLMKSLLIIFSLNSFADVACEQGRSAFKNTIYPELLNRCTDCHGDNGSAPKHSASNLDQAYEIALGSAHYPDFMNSRFLKKVKSSHWSDYGNYPEDLMTEAEANQFLSDWYNQGQKECEGQFKVETESISLPSDIPHLSTGKFKTLSFKVKPLNSLPDTEVKVEIDVQVFSEAKDDIKKSYRLIKPRIKSNHSIWVKDLKFIYGDIYYQSENGFFDLDQKVSGRKLSDSFPLLSLNSQILIVRENKKNTLKLGFSHLELIADPICPPENETYQDLLKWLDKTKCLSCHSNSTEDGFKKMPLSGDFCREILDRSNRAQLPSSIFIDVPSKGKFGHPQLEFWEGKRLRESYLKWLTSF